MKLQDVCSYVADKIDNSALNKDNYISTENMMQNCGGVTAASNVPVGKSTRFVEGDILFSNIRPYFKKLWRANTSGGCSADVLCIRANEKINPTYLYYLLTQDSFISYVMAGTKGCKMPRGDKQYNMAWNINLPSLDAQEKIAAQLSEIDDKIAVNRRICENLEAQAQALFKHWFIDFAPFKNGQFVESELGMIPEGWRVGRLGDFVSIKRGGSPRPIHKFISDKGLNWLKISDATSSNSPFIFDIKEHIIEEGLSKTVFLKAGELVLSNSATPCIPRFLCVDSCIHDGWLYFTNSQLSYEYLYLLFVNMRKLLLAQANGSVFLNLKTDIIKTQLVTYPGEKIMDDFNKIISPLFQSMKNLYTETKNLSTLRDTLLPKLMSGQIKV